MPPRQFSRHTFTTANLADGVLRLAEREPFRFRDLPDTIRHVVREGDTIFNLAARFFVDVSPRPAGLWWVIADFQPQPIVDPTLRLEPGSVIVIPSARTVIETVFNELRREESNVP